jgi:hypothetical protein
MAELRKTLRNFSLDDFYPSQSESLAPLECKLEALQHERTCVLKI